MLEVFELPPNLCRVGQTQIHNSPKTPINSHHMRNARKPATPTDNPNIAVDVTSPKPKAPGLSSANNNCRNPAHIANNNGMNKREQRLLSVAIRTITVYCITIAEHIHNRGTVRDKISFKHSASPHIKLGSTTRHSITVR